VVVDADQDHVVGAGHGNLRRLLTSASA